MKDKLPCVNFYRSKLAKFHRKCASLDEKILFQVSNIHRQYPSCSQIGSHWEEDLITRSVALLACEQEPLGPYKELLKLAIQFLEKVVPGLLWPLEAHNPSIKPCLAHEDLLPQKLSLQRICLGTMIVNQVSNAATIGHGWRFIAYIIYIRVSLEYIPDLISIQVVT